MTNWKEVNYIRQGESLNYDYKLLLPEPLADWDTFDYWEKERVISMRENLKHTDVLFDVGAEHGWMSVVFAKFCKVFLIEPTKEFWPNIYETWIRNVSTQPVGCFSGLVSDYTNVELEKESFGWPLEITGDLIDKNKYRYLHENHEDLKVTTIDDIVNASFIKPTALTIDVEGAESLVLKGAINLLKNNKIKVWVSIHPDLSLRDYKVSREEVLKFMVDLGYKGTLLGTDHEEHWFFRND